MTVSDEQKYRLIIDVLGIDGEAENLAIVDAWIAQSGIDEVYRRAIHIQECCA